MYKNLFAVAVLLLPLAACEMLEDPEDFDIGELDEEGRVINGRLINGRLINGRLINGTAFNGYVKAVKLDHVLVGGSYKNGVTLTSGAFSYGNPATITGAGFVGATFDGLTTDGKTVPIRIDSRRLIATDLPAYTLSYQTDVGWKLLCSDVAGSTAEAFALNGVWNLSEGVTGGGARSNVTGQFTFACSTTALGKCVNFGYVPWRSAGGQSLLSYHDSCVRAVRADYCGDGKSWTTDGTTINMYDFRNLQLDTEAWPNESVWTPTGASCVDKTRADQAVIDGQVLPGCATSKVKVGCRSDYNQSKPIATEFMPH